LPKLAVTINKNGNSAKITSHDAMIPTNQRLNDLSEININSPIKL
jgi:hypothetical protein